MSGFRGRMGLYELLTVTEGFKEKVSKEPNIDALRRQAISEGMRPLRLGGALKVAEGLTTIEEILASTPPLVLRTGPSIGVCTAFHGALPSCK
jgi:general secretion pathway protein E